MTSGFNTSRLSAQFKKQCRKLGIARWPHRKIKIVDDLIRLCETKAAALAPNDESRASLRGWAVQLQAVKARRAALKRGSIAHFIKFVFLQKHCLQAPTAATDLPAFVQTLRAWEAAYKRLERRLGTG